MTDLNLRRLRYFLALGAEPHFRRAAQRLHITQPVLSRQIRLLEEELGVELLARDGHSVRLTGVGRKLLRDGPSVVEAAAALSRSLRDSRPDRLGISFSCGISPSPLIRALAARHPDVDVTLLRTSFPDQTDALLDGNVDLALVRSPVKPQGLLKRFLYAEPLTAVLPAAHRLAHADEVTLTDLAGEALLQEPDICPGWRGGLAPYCPADLGEKLEYVASGRGVVILPAGAVDDYRRDGLAYTPVGDLPHSSVQLAWSGDAPTPFIDEAADLAVRVFAYSRTGTNPI